MVPRVLKELNAFICKVRLAKRHIQYRLFVIFLDGLTFEDEGTMIF
jgi:hypothetical protein